MNMSVNFPNSKSKHLNPEQTAEFGRRVDEIRREVMDSLGEQDAKYIYKIRNFVRYSEIASRGMLMFGGGFHQFGSLAQGCWVFPRSLKTWNLDIMSCTDNSTG